MPEATSPPGVQRRTAQVAGLSSPNVLAIPFRILLFLVPVLASFGASIPVVGPIFGFRAAVLLLLIVAMIRPGSSTVTARTFSPTRTILFVLAAAWSLVALLLLLVNGASKYAWAEGASLFIGLCLLVGIAGIRKSSLAIRPLIAGWLFAYFATSVVTLREVLFGVHFDNYYQEQVPNPLLEGFGSASTFANPNNYAFFLMVSLPVLIYGAFTSPTRVRKSLYVLAVASIPAFMLSTESRFGAILLVVTFLVFGIAFLPPRIALASGGLLVIVAVAAPAIAGSILQAVGRPFALIGAAASTDLGSFISGAFAEGSMVVRVNLVRNGIMFTLDTYLAGLGLGGFEAAMEAGHGRHQTYGIASPHNGVIEILSQFGVLVAGLFGLLLFILFLIGCKRFGDRSNAPSVRVAGLLLITLIVSFPVLTTMNSSFLEPSTSWLYLATLLLFGLAMEIDPGQKAKSIDGAIHTSNG